MPGWTGGRRTLEAEGTHAIGRRKWRSSLVSSLEPLRTAVMGARPRVPGTIYRCEHARGEILRPRMRARAAGWQGFRRRVRIGWQGGHACRGDGRCQRAETVDAGDGDGMLLVLVLACPACVCVCAECTGLVLCSCLGVFGSDAGGRAGMVGRREEVVLRVVEDDWVGGRGHTPISVDKSS